MGLRIQHNIAALNAHRHLTVTDRNLSKSIERLSSGYRINHAADDAAGLAISERFRAQIASLTVARRNVSEANSLLQVAEGALDQINSILVRMKELATQAASTNVGDDTDKLAAEYAQLVEEIDRIANSTKYANKHLINGEFNAGNTTTTWESVNNIYDINVTNAATGAYTVSYSAAAHELTIEHDGVSQTVTLSDGAQTVNFSTLGITFKTTDAAYADTLGAVLDTEELVVDAGTPAAFQVGYSNTSDDRITVSLDKISATKLGVTANDIDDATSAKSALDTIETAIATVAGARGDIGAYQNRLYYAASNVSITIENFTASESVIRDVDMAQEMTTFTKNQILLQAGTAMLAQANVAPQQVLALFG